jgi:hypothetical protein
MNQEIWENIGKRADLTTTKNKSFQIGIIAEDDSDVESIKVLINRISRKNNIGFKKFVGKGCGKIKRKANSWAKILKEKGCNFLILIHDLDKNNLEDLLIKITKSLDPCPINNHLICVPIQEFEAWLLSDTLGIMNAMKLIKEPKISGNTFDIDNPKEFLRDLIDKASNGEKIYLNTKHNEKISKEVSLEKVLTRNPSFKPFYDFIITNFKN